MNMHALFIQHFVKGMHEALKRLQLSSPTVMGLQLPSETA
jgi:hypothetical protein